MPYSRRREIPVAEVMSRHRERRCGRGHECRSNSARRFSELVASAWAKWTGWWSTPARNEPARSLSMGVLFDRGKHMIGVSAITRSDQDGLHLDEPAATSEAASQTLDTEEVSIAQRVEPPTEYIPAAGVGGRVYADTPTASGEYPDESSFFELAPLDPPVVEVESNLGQNEVVLGSETHAISSDHERLGTVIGLRTRRHGSRRVNYCLRGTHLQGAIRLSR